MNRIVFLLLILFVSTQAYGQEFDRQIEKTADTLASKIIASGRKKVAVIDFANSDQSTSQLGVFLNNEICANLANLSQNQIKFEVLERSNLEKIFEEKNLIHSTDGAFTARELGKIDAADILIFGTITDFEGYYRVVIKLLETHNGDMLSSYKVSFVKSPSLEKMYITPAPKKNGQIQPSSDVSDNSSSTTSSAGSGSPSSIDSGCASKNTGEYVFVNKTSKTMNVRLYSKDDVYTSNLLNELVIEPGQSATFYELSTGSYKCVVEENAYRSDLHGIPANLPYGYHPYKSQTQVLVEKCKSKTFDIR